MHKNVRAVLFLLTSVISVFSIDSFSLPTNNRDKIKNTVIFAWDFHDVLVQKQMSVLTKRLYTLINNSPNRWQLLYKVPQFLWDFYHIKKHSFTAEQAITALVKKHPILQQHYEGLLDAINTHKPISESIKLLKVLHNQGYTHILASNIGKYSLKAVIAREPDIFKHFNEAFIPYTDQQTGKFVGKPMQEYFISLANYVEQKYPETHIIIFIDDRKDNIKSAAQANTTLLKKDSNIQFLTIYFKNTAQAKKDIEEFFDTLKKIEQIVREG